MLSLIQYSYVAQASDYDWPAEPKPFSFVLLRDPNSFYWPNESLENIIYEENSSGFILVSYNEDAGIGYVRKILWNMSLAWEFDFDAIRILGVYHDKEFMGEDAVILCWKLSPDTTIVSILDYNSGSLLGMINISEIIGVENASRIEDILYEPANNVLFLHTTHEEFFGINLLVPDNYWYIERGIHTDVWDSKTYDNNIVVVYDVYNSSESRYNYMVEIIDPSTGNSTIKEFYTPTKWYYAWISPYSPHIILVPYLSDESGIKLVIYNYENNTLREIGPLPEIGIDYPEVLWSPNGKYVALPLSTPENHTLLIVSTSGDIIYRRYANYSYLLQWTRAEWSPDGVELEFAEATGFLYYNLYIYNVVEDNLTMITKVPEIYSVAWDIEDGRFYLAESPYTRGPIVYVFNRSNYELIAQGNVFHPYYVTDILLWKDENKNTHVYYIDNVHYDSEHGYWERLFVYHLYPVEIKEVIRLNASNRYQTKYYIMYLANPETLTWKNISGEETFNYQDASFTIRYKLKITITQAILYTYYGTSEEWDMTFPYGIIIIANITTTHTGNISATYQLIINITETAFPNKDVLDIIDPTEIIEGTNCQGGWYDGIATITVYYDPYTTKDRTITPLVLYVPLSPSNIQDLNTILNSINIQISVKREGGQQETQTTTTSQATSTGENTATNTPLGEQTTSKPESTQTPTGSTETTTSANKGTSITKIALIGIVIIIVGAAILLYFKK